MSLRLVDGRLVDSKGDDGTPTLDAVPETEASQDANAEYPTCETCGELNYEWQPGNRGRKPKYHADCKPIAPSRSSGANPRRNTALRNETALREALTARYVMMATIAGMRHPAYKQQVLDKTEQAVNADIAYAKVSPWFRKHLEGMLEKTAAGEVIAVHVAMLGPLMLGEVAHRGRTKQGRDKGKVPNPHRPQGAEQPPPTPRPDNVTDIRPDVDPYMPAEHEAPSGAAETVNAAAMDGMPG